jgi:lysophospholipid acyltransferase (LPLAT)-like uncharacterized protein
MKIKVSPRVAARIGHIFIRMLHATLRVRHVDASNIEQLHSSGRHYVLAFWHGQLPLMFFSLYRDPMTVMSSQHRDGEISARNMELFGARVVRGSTTRGGPAALRAMLKIAQSGSNLAFTPDGPRGPRRIAQIGVVAAAQMTGMPILPVVVLIERKKELTSWDRMGIPMPFSRVVFWYGEPIEVPRRSSREQLEQKRLELEHQLNNLSDEGEQRFAELYDSAPKRISRPVTT